MTPKGKFERTGNQETEDTAKFAITPGYARSAKISYGQLYGLNRVESMEK